MAAMSEQLTHPVLAEIERRRNGDSPQFKLALSIEGGGMRSVASAGMTQALEAQGIGADLFDAVFGASGGAFNAAYYIAGQSAEGMKGYWENTGRELIDFRRIGSRRVPIINMDHMLQGLSNAKPLDFDRVLRSQKLRPLATDRSTGSARAFQPAANKADLLRQLKAGSAVPLLGGKAVEIDGHEYFDAGIAERIPFETPIHEGYDAILILSTQTAIETGGNQSHRLARLALRSAVRRISPELASLSLQDPLQKHLQQQFLRSLTVNPGEAPHAFLINPSPHYAPVGRTQLDPAAVINGARAGINAVEQIFASNYSSTTFASS